MPAFLALQTRILGEEEKRMIPAFWLNLTRGRLRQDCVCPHLFFPDFYYQLLLPTLSPYSCFQLLLPVLLLLPSLAICCCPPALGPTSALFSCSTFPSRSALLGRRARSTGEPTGWTRISPGYRPRFHIDFQQRISPRLSPEDFP